MEQKHYYGKRTSKVPPALDIGVKYFSSSSDATFIRDQISNPLRYKYKIVRQFNTAAEAIAFESRLHHKFKVNVHESFYNKALQSQTAFLCPGQFPVKFVSTGEYAGLITRDDARYKSGELVSVNLGVGLGVPKPADFGLRQSARQRGVPKNRRDVENRRQTMSTPNVFEKSTFKQIGERVLEKKLQTVDECGRNMCQLIGAKSTATKRSVIDECGQNGFENAAIKCQETMRQVGDDGLTGYQRRGQANQKSPRHARYDIVHITEGVVYQSLTVRECRAIAYSLPERLSADTRIGKTTIAQKRLAATGKQHLIGLYLQPVQPTPL